MSAQLLTGPPLEAIDPAVAELIEAEIARESETICLIPSENYVSRAVLEAMGSVFTNKYSEGYPGRRYYEGQQVVDRLEPLAVERAKALFGVEHANVQPYSGSPANLATYLAFADRPDPGRAGREAAPLLDQRHARRLRRSPGGGGRRGVDRYWPPAGSGRRPAFGRVTYG